MKPPFPTQAEIVGAAAFALLVLHIQKLYDVMLQDDVSSVAQRNELTQYLDQMKVGKGLKTKIMRYISYASHMHTYSSFDDHDPRFAGLTRALKVELRVEIFRPILLRNPIFNKVPATAITAIAQQVLSRPCSPGERFIEDGTYGDCMFIILAGKVKVLDGTGAEFKVLRWSDVNNVKYAGAERDERGGLLPSFLPSVLSLARLPTTSSERDGHPPQTRRLVNDPTEPPD